jgi:hypothetical protein
MEAILRVLSENLSLASLIIGIALIMVAAIGAVRYSDQTFPIGTNWRAVLAALGFALTGLGIVSWFRARSPGGGKLKIDISRISGQGAPLLDYPYNKLTTVDGLLNKIYADLSPHLPPHSYGTDWVLINPENGDQLRQIGSRWAEQKGWAIKPGERLPLDDRVLKDAGITPSMTLVVQRLKDGEKQ